MEQSGSSPRQQSLEAALVENPDDLATHSAYADYLMEQGDPRGEFIQVQLLLEDPNRPAQERTRLRQREAELLRQHGRQWLGDLGRFLVGDWSGPDKPYHYQFVRGWLDFVRVLPFHNAIFASLAFSPEVRLLRRLEIVYDMRYHPFDFGQFVKGPNEALTEDEGRLNDPSDWAEEATTLPPLLDSPYLANLRVFKVGFSDSGDQIGHSTMISTFIDCTAEQVVELLRKCPHLEELYLNTNLPGIEELFGLLTLGNIRVLQYYFGTGYSQHGTYTSYPLTILAKNASLRSLTALRLLPGQDADINVSELAALLRSPHLPNLVHLQVHKIAAGAEACRAVVQSGILRRLKTLAMGYGSLNDEAAGILTACPDLKNLEVLDVSRNYLSPAGIAALQATGVRVVAEEQHPGEEEDFVYDMDFE
jgi:uncharacterized protein (TIGR02996 family)